MAKARIARDELREKVISAIRQQPGCQGVKEISLTSVNVVNGESSWRASILDSGTADFDAAYHAAAQITEEYSNQFQLAD